MLEALYAYVGKSAAIFEQRYNEYNAAGKAQLERTGTSSSFQGYTAKAVARYKEESEVGGRACLENE